MICHACGRDSVNSVVAETKEIITLHTDGKIKRLGMRILLTNDDGFQAPGIQALYERFQREHEVMLVAPQGERSAVGHGITINEPLRMHQVADHGISCMYAVSGRPADCVKLSLFEIYDTPPDLVISGINAGSNTGVNIHYSGTAGAAREAALNGIPAMAVSIQMGSEMDFHGMAALTETLARTLPFSRLGKGVFVNVNAPSGEIHRTAGIKMTRQAMENISTRFEKREDPRGRSYFWYGNMLPESPDETTDDAAVNAGFISVTPLRCDITDYEMMDTLAMGLEECMVAERNNRRCAY